MPPLPPCCSAAFAAFKGTRAVAVVALACFLMLLVPVGLQSPLVEDGASFADPVVVTAIHPSRRQGSGNKQELVGPLQANRQQDAAPAKTKRGLDENGGGAPSHQERNEGGARWDSETEMPVSRVPAADSTLEAQSTDSRHQIVRDTAERCRDSVGSSVVTQASKKALAAGDAVSFSGVLPASHNSTDHAPPDVSLIGGRGMRLFPKVTEGDRVSLSRCGRAVSRPTEENNRRSAVSDALRRSGTTTAPKMELHETNIPPAAPAPKTGESGHPLTLPKSTSRAATDELYLGMPRAALPAAERSRPGQTATGEQAANNHAPAALLDVRGQSRTADATRTSAANSPAGDAKGVKRARDQFCLRICRARYREITAATASRRRPESAVRARVSLVDGPVVPAKGVTAEPAGDSAGTNETATSAAASDTPVLANETATQWQQRRGLSRYSTLRGGNRAMRTGSGLRRAYSLPAGSHLHSRRLGRQSPLADLVESPVLHNNVAREEEAADATDLNSFPHLDTYEEILSACDCLDVGSREYAVQTLSDGWGSLTLLVIAGFVACVAFFVAVLLIAWHFTMQATPASLLVEPASAVDEGRRRAMEARHAVAVMSSGRWQTSGVEPPEPGTTFQPSPSTRKTAACTAPTRVYYVVEKSSALNSQCLSPDDRTPDRRGRYLVKNSPYPVSKPVAGNRKASPVRKPGASKRRRDPAEPSQNKTLLREEENAQSP